MVVVNAPVLICAWTMVSEFPCELLAFDFEIGSIDDDD